MGNLGKVLKLQKKLIRRQTVTMTTPSNQPATSNQPHTMTQEKDGSQVVLQISLRREGRGPATSLTKRRMILWTGSERTLFFISGPAKSTKTVPTKNVAVGRQGQGTWC